ncbi:hypothetical protein [Methylovulum psychrotolerans]|jgi:hypothetical protein|uniref:Phosphate ABC transporter substrate-binding protein n=1 Tax=Methylovulum psychrotolerans TaxID=1704499 RepID=A0A2S5CG50_9GAMM|nr:hypothetical protein [Methylovulum psychrotolerans]POZ49780.1 hypothetical protein AADEFJLK_04456 [Methylovulum psychrotolerans]
MMFTRTALFCLTALALIPAHADEIWLVTGLDTPFKTLSHKTLENIFLRKTLLNEDGSSWIPLNLNPEHPVRQAFSEALFHRRAEALEPYWNEQYFHGLTPPYVVASEEAMLRFVSGTRGAIGYVLPCHSDARVQVVFKLPVRDDLKGQCGK